MGVEVSSILSLTSALNGVGGQPNASAAVPPSKTWYPFNRRLGGPQGRSRRVQKNSSLPRFDPRTVQPIASRLTAYPGPTFCPEIDMNSGYGRLQFISSPFDAGCLPSLLDVPETTKLSKFGEIQLFIVILM